MGLVLLVFGIIIVLFVLNMFYFDEVEVDVIGYNYNSDGERITEEQAMKLAKSKYNHKKYTFEDKYSTIYVSKKKLMFGLKDSGSVYDTNYHEIFGGVLAILFILWAFIIGLTGLFRLGNESEYLQKQNQYNVLIAQLERVENYDEQNYIVSGDIGSLEDIYQKVTEYNNWVIRNRYWSENQLMWFFYNQYASELELIELQRSAKHGT